MQAIISAAADMCVLTMSQAEVERIAAYLSFVDVRSDGVAHEFLEKLECMYSDDIADTVGWEVDGDGESFTLFSIEEVDE